MEVAQDLAGYSGQPLPHYEVGKSADAMLLTIVDDFVKFLHFEGIGLKKSLYTWPCSPWKLLYLSLKESCSLHKM